MAPVVAPREGAESKPYDVAERQARCFTASQALEAGYSHASQSYHHKAGNWLRDGWGIYRLAHFPHVAGEDFVRLMLWSRDRAGVMQRFDRDPHCVRQRAFGADQREAQPQSVVGVPHV